MHPSCTFDGGQSAFQSTGLQCYSVMIFTYYSVTVHTQQSAVCLQLQGCCQLFDCSHLTPKLFTTQELSRLPKKEMILALRKTHDSEVSWV